MIKKLFFPLAILSLAFLNIASVDAAHLPGEEELVDRRANVSIARDVASRSDVDDAGDSPLDASASQPFPLNPHIRIGEDGLLRIDGLFVVLSRKDIPGKADREPSTVYFRTASDRDFLLGEGEEAPAEALTALGQLTAEECGMYPPSRFGFVTIQRRHPVLMEPFINGPRAPRVTIGDHWAGAAPGWRNRLLTNNAATCYVLEKEGREGDKVPFGHCLLGSLNATQLILSLVLEETDWGRGVGEGALRYILETLIPTLSEHSLTQEKMKLYASLVMLMDDQNSVSAGVEARLAEFQQAHPGVITHEAGIPRGDTRPGYEGRTGHRWVFDLKSFKAPSSPFTPSSDATTLPK